MLNKLHMLQVFQINVASVCSKIFHLFRTYVSKHFDLYVVYVSHICCKSMFQIFQSYVAGNVFMLQVVSVYLEVALLQLLYTYVASVYFKCFSCF
jgi:hypothetical protein